jgi:3-hydroxyisobutyrate dehydrogenase-like beta-hydroxyacid dehydrogenase
MIERIAFIGFGELGSIFSRDLAAAGKDVVVFDLLFLDPKAQGRMTERAQAANVRTAQCLRDAIVAAELILAATTASSALRVAQEAAGMLQPGQVYVDLNSVSPERKKQIAAKIEKSGADFVEAAVMAAVKAVRLKTPILLGGGRAAELADALRSIGMDTTAVSDKIGVASAIKMCRSVVMKGMAALAIESLFTARRYGAEEAVLASFDATYPGMGWKRGLPDQLVMRSVEHSRRRAAEMRESAETIADSGITPRMSLASAELQDWLTAEMEAGYFTYQASEPFSWSTVADALNHAKKSEP